MSKSKNFRHIYYIVITALFSAIITVFTAYIKFNTGINNGYVHFGDSMIYLASCILPTPYAMLAAAIGGGVADILAGSAMWAPFTALIKALNAVPFSLVYSMRMTKSSNKILNKATCFMPLASGVITIFGYLLVEGLLYTFPTALTSVPFSIIQAVGSAIIYYIAAAALDKLNFKNRIFKSF